MHLPVPNIIFMNRIRIKGILVLLQKHAKYNNKMY